MSILQVLIQDVHKIILEVNADKTKYMIVFRD